MSNGQIEGSEDPRRRRVLDGAVKIFLAYGFQRTTMDDIARAAEMSRPALYLIFRNKSDIYRAIATEMFGETVVRARTGLAKEGPIGELLMASVAEPMFEFMQLFRDSPHGADILDMKNNLARDIISETRRRMAMLVTNAIDKQASDMRVDLAARALSAGTLAQVYLDGLDGIKMQPVGETEQREAARQLACLIDLALRP